MAVDGPDDDLVLGKLPQPCDDELAVVAGGIVAVIGLVDVDETIILGTGNEMKKSQLV